MDEREDERKEEERRLGIDEMADFHARLATLESQNIRMSRRLTRVEDGRKGNFEDQLGGILSPGLMWALVVLSLAPIILDTWKQWKSSSSSS